MLGEGFLTSNIETGEWSYQKSLNRPIKGHKFLDIRFVKNNVSVLIETKRKFRESDQEQLFTYTKLEKELTKNNVISILANTSNNDIQVWKNGELLKDETKIRSIEEYEKMFDVILQNDREKVMMATYDLNELLHHYSIGENLRSQFVGTCLLAIKNGLTYSNLTTKQILIGIHEVLNLLLNNDLKKAEKLVLLDKNILEHQDIKNLEKEYLINILDFINEKILPFIDERSNEGQDLLSLFFTTFNKYVGKKDKNQAFTPDHIVHFMCKIAKINRNSRVLDPTCGSGSFIVQAMVQAIKNCRTSQEINKVKKEQIYGIEYEDQAFGLATTNMLIHGDGNSNVKQGSCFDKKEFIKDANINVILMNPPYNGQRKHLPKTFTETWDRKTIQDPTKGFYFVNYVAETVKQGKLLCLLPMSAAIGTKDCIEQYKKKMLEENTLEAVFSLPSDIFYPGASASVCCMVFTLNQPHPQSHKTFFGYFKDDGFSLKKPIGRIDRKSLWNDIESEWISLYEGKITKSGLSVMKNVNYDDEWLAEAYMETDYEKLVKPEIFEEAIRDYLSYLVKKGDK